MLFVIFLFFIMSCFKEEEKMKITITGFSNTKQQVELLELLKKFEGIDVVSNVNKNNDESEKTNQYIKLAKYIHNLIDLICERKPHLRESFIENTPYPDFKDFRSNWRLVDWINEFPKDNKRIDFLLYKNTFLYIGMQLTIEYFRSDGDPKEYVCCVKDISKDDYSVEESLELLKKFKSIV